jgi:phage N-6-adenine-methyltransferase
VSELDVRSVASQLQSAHEVSVESRRIVELIRQEGSLEGLKRLADRAEGLRLLVKKAGFQLEYQNEAAYARLCAEREIGKVLATIARGKAGRPPKNSSPEVTDYQRALVDLSVPRQVAKKWEKEAEVPTETFEEYAERCRAKEEELTSAGVRTLANRLAGGTTVVQSLTNEWYTPGKYLDAARIVLDGIDLDPASCDEANETVQAADFYTEDDDGLSKDWHGRVWLNPPYGRIAGDFIEHLADQYEAGNVLGAVALVNAHCTDTRWFQRLWDHTLCFTDHRIDFAAGTADRSGSTHGSVFAYLGRNPQLFADHFAEFGAVVRRWPWST